MLSLTNTKKVLYIDLSKNMFEVKKFPDLAKYLGGVALGFKLYSMHMEKDPVVFSIGPLNGFFPFVSKTAVVLKHGGVIEDLYLGGSLSFRLKFAGVDAIVLLGKSATPVILDVLNDAVTFNGQEVAPSSLGLPGKKSVLTVSSKQVLLDGYFSTSEEFLYKKLLEKNVWALAVTGGLSYKPAFMGKYMALYNDLLKKENQLLVAPDRFPSCSGCPLGCKKSSVGELGGNILGHCLVACDFAQYLYSDANIVFSCLNVLGYDYKHEDIEQVPNLVEELV
jgi:aldehyde:ferredoxin oxidoreductase